MFVGLYVCLPRINQITSAHFLLYLFCHRCLRRIFTILCVFYLFRHVGLNLKFPQLHLFYWGSFTKNLGAELNLGAGSLNTVYKVGIEEFRDGLIRRPAATWCIMKLDSEIDDVTCYVTGIEDKGPRGQQTEVLSMH